MFLLIIQFLKAFWQCGGGGIKVLKGMGITFKMPSPIIQNWVFICMLGIFYIPQILIQNFN